jgi:hypothetical protein
VSQEFAGAEDFIDDVAGYADSLRKVCAAKGFCRCSSAWCASVRQLADSLNNLGIIEKSTIFNRLLAAMMALAALRSPCTTLLSWACASALAASTIGR